MVLVLSRLIPLIRNQGDICKLDDNSSGRLLGLASVLVSTAVKQHHAHSNSYKHLIGVAYVFRGSVHYHPGVTRWRVGRQDAGAGTEGPYILTWATGTGLGQWV